MGTHFIELPDWFTIEQAFRGPVGKRVSVTDTLKFLADLNNNKIRTQIYNYHISHELLDKDGEYVNLNMGGVTSQQIKPILYYGPGKKDNDKNIKQLVVENKPVENIDNFKFPDGIRWNILFGAEILRNLNPDEQPEYDLLDLGNPFLQQGRNLIQALTDSQTGYLNDYKVPYFSRFDNATPENDPYSCCGLRWKQVLKSAKNVNFKNSYFNGREWESDSKYLPDAIESYSSRLYPARFEGTPDNFLDLEGAVFDGASLQNVVFRYCNLKNASFEGAKLHDAIFIDNVYGNTNFKNIEAFALGIDATGPQKYGPTKRKRSTGVVYFANSSEFNYNPNNKEWVVVGTIWTDVNKQLATRKLDISLNNADIRGSRFSNLELTGDFTDINAEWLEFENVQFKPNKLHNSAFKYLYVKNNRNLNILEEEKKLEMFPIGLPPSFLRREDTVSDPTPYTMVKYKSTDLTNADFTNPLDIVSSITGGLDLSSLKKIENVNFSGANMSNVDLSGLEIINCTFIDCSFNGANFDFAKLPGCKFNDSDMIGATFNQTDFREVVIGDERYLPTILGGCDFTDAVLANCYITGAKFRENFKTNPKDKRRTKLKNTLIYWDNIDGIKTLGFDPTLPTNENRFSLYLKNEDAIDMDENMAWPYGLFAIFNQQGREPFENNDKRRYDTPDIYFQLIEGLNNISNITELISDAGSNLSKTTKLGNNLNGLTYDNTTDTSQPLTLTMFQSENTNIRGLNFNNCILSGANFNGSFTDYSPINDNSTFFQNILATDSFTDDYSISFRDAVFEGRMHFEDADLVNADFTNAIINHPNTSFSILEKDGYTNEIISPYIKDENGKFPLESDLKKDFRNRILGRAANLDGAIFENVTFNNGVNFKYTKILGTNFKNVKGLNGCANLRYLRCENENYFDSDPNNDIIQIQDKTTFENTDLQNCILDYSVLHDVDFTNVNLSNASLKYCDVRGSNFNNCDLTNVSFSIIGDKAEMLKGIPNENWAEEEQNLTNRRKKYIENIDIRYAILSETNFSGYDLNDLTKLVWPVGYYSRDEKGQLTSGLQIGAIAVGGHLNYIPGVDNAGGVKAISGFWKLQAGVLEMPNTDFTYSGSLDKGSISKKNQYVGYKKYLVNETSFINDKGEPIIKYQVNNTYVLDHWADKESTERVHRNENSNKHINAYNSKFFHVNYDNNVNKRLTVQTSTFFNIDFTSSDFRYIKLQDVNFSNCIFTNCKFMGATIITCGFDNCIMKNVDFGDLTDMVYINNTRTTLSDVNMINCDLEGSNFKHAILNDVKTSKCEFKDVDFEDATLNNLAICKVPTTMHWSEWDSLMNDETKKQVVEEKKDSYKPRMDGARREFFNVGKSAIEETVYNNLDEPLMPAKFGYSYNRDGSTAVVNERKRQAQKDFLHKFHSNLRVAQL